MKENIFKSLSFEQKMILVIISGLFVIAFMIQPTNGIPVCGNLSLNSSSTVYTMEWMYNPSDNINTMSIDGINLEGFDNQSGVYIRQRVSDGETSHTLRITNGSDSACNTSTFEPVPASSSDRILGFIDIYLLFIFGIILVVIGAFIPIVGLPAAIVGIIGMGSSVGNSFAMGVLFLIIIIAGLVECLTFSY